MNASAQRIHQALEAVAELRARREADPEMAQASFEIKHFQATRFQATYGDLLKSSRYKAATQFFLTELYGDKDYASRDQQFARIAGTIARLFPQAVVNTAAALAEVHALTERLDYEMAKHWLDAEDTNPTARYVACWRQVGDFAVRHKQLEVVLELGQSLNDLTRKPGLRTLLKMMRVPAAAAGLESLQKFLETGFDSFSAMRGAEDFLKLISQRESEWITALFSSDTTATAAKLDVLMNTFQR